MQNEWVTINSRKYDLSIRRRWKCQLVEREDPMLVFVGEFDETIDHPALGLIQKGTTSYEYYWLDRWYNIFRFHEPDGSFRNFYCNINMPPTFDGRTLDYVDLDIDVIVWSEGRIITLDEDEFESNAVAFSYPPEVRKKALDSLDEIHKMILSQAFPFEER
ncbi:MAG: DUF402 domain-containing protein [Pyrinomonadaceae bacterium]